MRLPHRLLTIICCAGLAGAACAGELEHRTVVGFGGVPLAVVEAGNRAGPPILFIHGGSQATPAWKKQLLNADLGAAFHLIAFDLRGHGASAKPWQGDAYGADPFAGDVKAVIEATTTGKVVLVAWSYGGNVALAYVAKFGLERVAGINITASRSAFGPSTRRAELSAAERRALDSRGAAMRSDDLVVNATATRDFIGDLSAAPLSESDLAEFFGFNMMTPAYARRAMRSFRPDNRNLAAELSVPVLVSHGNADVLVSVKDAQRIQRMIVGSRLSIYEDVGHMPFYERPQRFNRELAELVRNVHGEPVAQPPLVIAHRGASGYLPEHTLAAKAMAHGQGADYIEQDLVMTRDNELVVLHDIHLDAVSNVRDLFPDRMREDGRYYVIDFTLQEIRQLTVMERFNWREGPNSPVFPDRFPSSARSLFRVHTFAEEIELIKGLNQSTGRVVGIYPEMKNPAFHHAAGKDIARTTLGVLKGYGYLGPNDPVFLQCFDAQELKRIHSELLPALGMSVRLIQLLAPIDEHQPLLNPTGLAAIAEYAVGIGPGISMIVDPDSKPASLKVTKLVQHAHAAGLQVHPYTFRRDAGEVPGYAADYNDLLRIFLHELGVDGVFTDFPDLTLEYLRSNATKDTK